VYLPFATFKEAAKLRADEIFDQVKPKESDEEEDMM
jgi:hypothetical protein